MSESVATSGMATPIETFRNAERRLFADYGVDFDERFVELPAPRLRVRVIVVGDGPPLVLVHGGLSVAAQWAPLLPHLKGFRLYIPDRSGCGLTEGWDHRRDDLREHGTHFITSLLDALDLEQAPFIANSMGALWSLWFAVAHPKRAMRLALLGCPALLEGTSAPFPMRLMAVPGLNRLLFSQVRPDVAGARQSMKMIGHTSTLDRIPSAFLQVGAASSALPTFRVHFLSLIESALTLAGPRRQLIFGGDLSGRVRCPVVLLWGQADPFGSLAAARRAAALMPEAHVETVGVGHLPWLDEPERCGELLCDFLAANPKPQVSPNA